MLKVYVEPKDRKDIIEKYNMGFSILALTKTTNYSYTVINRILKEENIPIRDNSYTARKYHCNSNIFEEINTEEKAYWLGFLYADGYISPANNSYTIGLALSSIDKEHIEKFKIFLETDYPIHEYVSTGYKPSLYSRLHIKDKKIGEDLIKYGILPQKTSILAFPKISENLIPHFIRGYFDGDGCLTCHKFNKNSSRLIWVIKFCGTENMLKNIYNNLPRRYNNPINLYQRYKRDNNNYCIDIGGNKQVLQILNYLYKDATIYLERKYKKYQELVEQDKEKQNEI